MTSRGSRSGEPRSARRGVPVVLGMLGVLATLAALDGVAAAGPLADALARHGEAEVAALREQRDDTASRCTLGAVYARRNDLPRAALFLADCEHAELPADVASAIAQAAREVVRRLELSPYARLDIVSQPEGLTADIDGLPGETFTTPATVWVAAGAHTVHAQHADQTSSYRVIAEPHKNAVVMIEAARATRPATSKPQVIDIGQDDTGGSLGEEHTGPPPDIKHPPLMKDKYRGIADPASGEQIDDPLAMRAGSGAARDHWIGLRVGAGMFDDGAAAARAGIALGIAGRIRISEAAFVAARADWSRRGGEVMATPAPDPIDVLGASAGVGVTVIGRAAANGGLALALIGQLRGDLRLATRRDAAAVHRAGLGIAAGAELALPATPLTVGVRVEQGLTTLVAGARDRAVLAELGVDLR